MHILVTGATGGIGRGICEVLAAQNTQNLKLTVCNSKGGDSLNYLQKSLSDMGVWVRGIWGDVSQVEDAPRLVREAIAEGGDLDALVCVAGASGPGNLTDLSVQQWDQTFNLNTRSVFLMAQAAYASLKRTQGSITAIASMSGLHPHPGYGAYSPAKAALIMLCRQLAQEWGPDGIRTNTVCPGMVRTPLTEAVYRNPDIKANREALVPLGRIGRPDDIGQAVSYLISAGAAYVNGQNLVVDGGVADHMLTMIPGRPGKPALKA
jgi:3-oxoacyl-[acyl-carrier protein] reductase